jgi:Ca2+-binding EF-hand superfamily protein
MTVSEMQSSLQKMENEFIKNNNSFSESQRTQIKKAFRILKSNASKLQSRDDVNFSELKANFNPKGFEYYSETDLIY